MLSPTAMLTGINMDFNQDCWCEFGQCAHANEEPDPTNSMDEHTTGAMCLGKGNNLQGSHRFVSLTSGKVLNHCGWTETPIANDVIRRVEELAGDDALEHSVF